MTWMLALVLAAPIFGVGLIIAFRKDRVMLGVACMFLFFGSLIAGLAGYARKGAQERAERIAAGLAPGAIHAPDARIINDDLDGDGKYETVLELGHMVHRARSRSYFSVDERHQLSKENGTLVLKKIK